MIIIIVGGVGSGKTLTIIKEILSRNKKCYINFPIMHKNVTRLKEEHIIKETPQEKGKPMQAVNWDYWKEKIKNREQFDIFIDEAHNVLNSRRAMSKWNLIFTSWLTQVRKILGQSETNHLYLITQRLNSLDPVARELCHMIISCQKFQDLSKTLTVVTEDGRKKTKLLEDVYIMRYFFTGEFCIEKYTLFKTENRGFDGRAYFYGNPLFKYYDSYALLDFGESAYL